MQAARLTRGGDARGREGETRSGKLKNGHLLLQIH